MFLVNLIVSITKTEMPNKVYQEVVSFHISFNQFSRRPPKITKWSQTMIRSYSGEEESICISTRFSTSFTYTLADWTIFNCDQLQCIPVERPNPHTWDLTGGGIKANKIIAQFKDFFMESGSTFPTSHSSLHEDKWGSLQYAGSLKIAIPKLWNFLREDKPEGESYQTSPTKKKQPQATFPYRVHRFKSSFNLPYKHIEI